MSRRYVFIVAGMLLVLSWIVLPWQLAESTGTGDGIVARQFLQFAPLSSPPQDIEVVEDKRKPLRSVQIDWAALVFENALIIGLAVFLSRRSAARQESNLQN